MGLKRKASALFDDRTVPASNPASNAFGTSIFAPINGTSNLPTINAYGTPQPPSSPPSLTSSASANSSPSSMTTEPYQTYQSFDRALSSPTQKPQSHDHVWINTRTRKRFRDNRPSESLIHSSTLNKLYSAQKEHLDNTAELPIPMQIEDEDMYGGWNGEAQLEGDTMVEDQQELSRLSLLAGQESKEEGQRSLHFFFGGREPEQGAMQDGRNHGESQKTRTLVGTTMDVDMGEDESRMSYQSEVEVPSNGRGSLMNWLQPV